MTKRKRKSFADYIYELYASGELGRAYREENPLAPSIEFVAPKTEKAYAPLRAGDYSDLIPPYLEPNRAGVGIPSGLHISPQTLANAVHETTLLPGVLDYERGVRKHAGKFAFREGRLAKGPRAARSPEDYDPYASNPEYKAYRQRKGDIARKGRQTRKDRIEAERNVYLADYPETSHKYLGTRRANREINRANLGLFLGSKRANRSAIDLNI
jgi:hypothetical protein